MHPVDILDELRSMSSAKAIDGLARYGIRPDNRLGVSIPALRRLARKIGRNYELAGELWASGIPDARILAGMIDDPALVTEAQLESWALDLDSWDVCDQCCSNLFGRTTWALEKAMGWSRREEEFVKRCGFVLMAHMAVHHKEAGDEVFGKFLQVIEREATDDRNFVKKAVNWALRQIGKRNRPLNVLAVETSRRIMSIPSRAARWIARDALRELTGVKVQTRIGGRQTPASEPNR